MKYLVDANILSELTNSHPLPQVTEWLRDHAEWLVVNPVILGELEFGILQLPAGRKRKRLLEWFASGMRMLTVAEITLATAHEWATLLAELRRKGKSMPVKDSLIAATAREYGLTVVTRNTVDFQHCGVSLVNPFED